MRDVYRPGYESVQEVPNLTAEQLEQSLREGGIWNEMTELAMKQADIAHADRYRHSGRPYLEEHVYPVTLEAVQYLRDRGKSLERQQTMACAGLLHDTV